MARQLDDAAGDMLKLISENQGIQIHTGVQIEEIQGDSHVTGVKLGSGEVIPAELVIMSPRCSRKYTTGKRSRH